MALRFLLLLFALPLAGQNPARSVIPLDRCDKLSVVMARIGSKEYRFLLDTGATSLLNNRTFKEGKDQALEVASWRSVDSVAAREVTLSEITFGDYTLPRARIPAIDLDPIGKACGKPIDGILGVDLLERMGVTIDLKQRVAVIPAAVHTDAATAAQAAIRECFNTRFNAGDAKSFGDCLAADVDWFTPAGKMSGRETIVAYLEKGFFSRKARILPVCKGVHPLGDSAVIFDYEYTMELPARRYHARGTGVAVNQAGTWRVVNIHHSDQVELPLVEQAKN